MCGLSAQMVLLTHNLVSAMTVFSLSLMEVLNNNSYSCETLEFIDFGTAAMSQFAIAFVPSCFVAQKYLPTWIRPSCENRRLWISLQRSSLG